jgi:hypothetical protein
MGIANRLGKTIFILAIVVLVPVYFWQITPVLISLFNIVFAVGMSLAQP